MLERQWAEHVVETYWAPNPTPIDPKAIASAMGVRVQGMNPFDPAFESSVSGMYTNEGGQPTIYFNVLDSANRQRFTIAHELGHHVLHNNHGKRFRDTSAALQGGTYDPVEVQANRFAAELLMPDYAVHALIVDNGVASIERLAQSFGVSEKAMQIRLKNLGYID